METTVVDQHENVTEEVMDQPVAQDDQSVTPDVGSVEQHVDKGHSHVEPVEQHFDEGQSHVEPVEKHFDEVHSNGVHVKLLSTETPKGDQAENSTVREAVANSHPATNEDNGPDSDMCCMCSKRVYPMERFTADKRLYHKTCFRCSKCKRLLGVDFAVNNGALYCNPHFMEIFKMRGRYDDSAVEVIPTEHADGNKEGDEPVNGSGPRASTKDLLAKFRELETEPSGTADSGTHRPSVLDDELPPQDTARTMAAKWKAMENSAGAPPTPEKSSQMQKKARETVNVRVAPPHVTGESSPSPDEVSETGSGVSENKPRPTAEGVVRSEIGEIRSDEMPQSGITRSLLARFQAAQ